VYAFGVREADKMMGLALGLDSIAGLRYKVDTNHDIVYMEFSEQLPDADSILAWFRRINLDPKFVGQMPPEIGQKKKTQLIDVSSGA